MKVLVYVEGPSDRDALRALLRSVLAEGQRRRVGIQFLPLGDKARILDTSAGKAARHLGEHPEDWVVALPDLYPMSQYNGTPNEHRSSADLERLLTERFAQEARRRRVAAQAQGHFRVHCLKHDLEVLLLACPDQLRQRLGTDHALGQWRSPVENQNDQHSAQADRRGAVQAVPIEAGLRRDGGCALDPGASCAGSGRCELPAEHRPVRGRVAADHRGR